MIPTVEPNTTSLNQRRFAGSLGIATYDANVSAGTAPFHPRCRSNAVATHKWEVTLAESLSAVGYATALYGKWQRRAVADQPLHQPRAEADKPTVDSWVVGPVLKMIAAFEESTKAHPLIPMGTPDPYVPPAAAR